MRPILTAALMTALFASTALCDNGDFQWQGKLTPGQSIIVRGVFGSIHAQGASDGIAVVTAHKTAGVSDPNAVSIQAVTYDGGVVVCPIYPSANPDKPNNCNPPGKDSYSSVDANNDVQVELTIQVPQGVRFTAVALRGDIDAIALTADVEANTIDGNVTISTTGAAQGSSLHGSLTAAIGRVDWTGFHMFASGNGNVDVQLPANANVSVRASAHDGAILSDFPLTLHTFPGGTITNGEGTLGSGGRSLLLSALNGNITLRKGPASGQ